jgi:hypothetical protein
MLLSWTNRIPAYRAANEIERVGTREIWPLDNDGSLQQFTEQIMPVQNYDYVPEHVLMTMIRDYQTSLEYESPWARNTKHVYMYEGKKYFFSF